MFKKMGDPNLVTTCNFHGQEFLFKMNVLHNTLDILITDKNSGEEWQCSYDATYVENLTHKTGNFKQFEIFVTMIKSGLLRTSECVTLDLLTYDDLEALRSRKITKACASNNSNRRYLIVTYCVEFDKIRYPLPLEYCGPPDPVILQGTIRRLELELARTKEELAVKANNSDSRKIYFLQKRVDELTEENIQLQEEIRLLTRQLDGKTKPKSQMLVLQKAVDKLEKSVISERSSRHELVQKLKNDNVELNKQLEKVKQSERNLKARLTRTVSESPTRTRMEYGVGDYAIDKEIPVRKKSNQSLKTMYRNKSPYVNKNTRYWDCPANPKQRTTRTQKNPLSQSSSSSSAKYMDVELHNDPLVSPMRSPCRSKPSSPGAHSRSSSVGSRGSSKMSARVRLKKATGKASDLDFAKLERKIESLHKILKMNVVPK